MGKRKSRERHTTIRQEIIFYYALLIIGVVILITAATTIIFNSRYLKQNYEISSKSLDAVSVEIQGNIVKYRSIVTGLSGNQVLVKILTESSGTAESPLISNILYQSLKQTGEIAFSTIITTENEVCDTLYSRAPFSNNLIEITGFENFIASGKEQWFSTPHAFPLASRNDDYFANNRITYYSILREHRSFDRVGFLMLNIDKERFFDTIIDPKNYFDELYIFDKQSNLIYTLDSGKNEAITQSATFIDKAENNSQYQPMNGRTFFYKTIPNYPSWIIVGVSDNHRLYSDSYTVMLILGLIGFLAIIVAILISDKISAKITRPISAISEEMVMFELGEIPNKIVTNKQPINRESKMLVDVFNAMTDDISIYIDAIYNDAENVKNAETAALKFQLEALQQQINPHFLYNTLNTVSYLADQKQTEEIKELIRSLNTLLRSTISNMQEFWSLSQEVFLLHAYVNIQSYRYPDMIELEVDIEEVCQVTVPKLILQPLVENAIIHGLFPKQKKGAITVLAKAIDGGIEVKISDDGVGMEKQMVDSFNEGIFFSESIGIYNVDKRLKLYYGENSKLVFSSELNKGTVVRFSIPSEGKEY